MFEELISDNEAQYSSNELKTFIKEYGIQHTTLSPVYPHSKGLAHKAVQIMKMMLNKCKEAGQDLYLALPDLRNIPGDNDITSTTLTAKTNRHNYLHQRHC